MNYSKEFWDVQPLGKMPDGKLGERLGRTASAVRYQRDKCNIAPYDGGKGRPSKTTSGQPGRVRTMRLDDGEWDELRRWARQKTEGSIPDLIRLWLETERAAAAAERKRRK